MRIELRSDNNILIDGYVNAVARDSRIMPSINGEFVEQVVPGTFHKALSRTRNVDLLLNHNESRKLGSIIEGNLKLFEDNIGLRAIATITDEEVIEKAIAGKLKGWSFGFYLNNDRWETDSKGIKRRFLEDIELLEVSILDNTKNPAYIATSIETRDNKEVLREIRTADFNAVVEDISQVNKNKIINSIYKKELQLLRLRGGND
jgi:HK97 family phage prohead protease|nr:MAG TPA: head maturation protease [Caudoviricetes sp.]